MKKHLLPLWCMIATLSTAVHAQTPVQSPFEHQRPLYPPGIIYPTATEATSGTTQYHLLGMRVDNYSDITGKTEPGDSVTYTYSNGRGDDRMFKEPFILGAIEMDYDVEHHLLYQDSAWLNHMRKVQIFDARGNLSSATHYYWLEGENTWLKAFIERFYYDPAGQRTAAVWLELDTDGTITDGSDSTVITYDSLRRPVADTIYNIPAGSWEPVATHRMTYSTYGLSQVVQLINRTGNWEEELRSSFTYASGRMTEHLSEQWDGMAWVAVGKDLSAYHQNGKIHTTESWAWDSLAQQLAPQVRETYQWREDYLLSQISEAYDAQDSSFHAYQLWTAVEWNTDSLPTLMEMRHRGMQGDTVLTSETHLYWESFSAGIGKAAHPSPEKILVYPNPARNTIHLNVPVHTGRAQVQFYDMQGRLRMQEAGLPSGHQTLDLSELPSGQYTLILVAGESYYQAKVVKLD